MRFLDHLAWLLPLLSLVGGLAWHPIRTRWGARIAAWACWSSCALAAIGWGIACSVLVGVPNAALVRGTSLSLGYPLPLNLYLGLEIDIVSALFGLVVAAVSVVIAWPDILEEKQRLAPRHIAYGLAAISLTITAADYVILLLGWAAISCTVLHALDPRDRASRHILAAGYGSDGALAMGVVGLVCATGTSGYAAISKDLLHGLVRDGPAVLCVTGAIGLAVVLRLAQLTWLSLRVSDHDDALPALTVAWGVTLMPGAVHVLLRAQPLYLVAPTMQQSLSSVGIVGLIACVAIAVQQRVLVAALSAASTAACMLWMTYLPLGMLDLATYHALVLIGLAPSLMWVRLTQHIPEGQQNPDREQTRAAVQGVAVIALAAAILTLLGAPLMAGSAGPAFTMIYGRYEGFGAAWTVGLIANAIMAFWLGLVLFDEMPANILAAWRYAGDVWRAYLPWAPHIVWLVLLTLGSTMAYTVRRWVAPWSMAVGAHRMPGLWRPTGQQWLVMACVTYLPFGTAALLQWEPIAAPLGDTLERLAPYLPRYSFTDIAKRLGIPRSRVPRRQLLETTISAMAVICLVLYALLVAP